VFPPATESLGRERQDTVQGLTFTHPLGSDPAFDLS
jgi:hypothetical protein